ncbi:Hint domain-containing protein [Shimia marina]|uniref:Cyclolysin n=1 Tax=Shimia marina TaxID=321267 RepID=A0A0P1EK31_9RHOB|nr:Hint domain-containing protein [Shimia marina]CUH50834.1 Cyclolysin [Shimia marina]SFE54279.1 Ca2+-binding protein, RTX toxin-related [Shimia marina]
MADPNGPGIVDGSETDDTINVGFTDSNGDTVDNSGNVISAQDGDDSIHAGAGDDTIFAGDGDDTVRAGDGDDIVAGDEVGLPDGNDTPGDDLLAGEGGSDTIDGMDGDDTIYGGYAPGTTPVPSSGGIESFNWDGVGTPADGDSLTGPFVQDTGSVTVTYTTTATTGGSSTFEDDTQLLGGVNTGTETGNTDSSVRSTTGAGEGATTSQTLAFSETVENAQFRINDMDENAVVKVIAWDADGNLIDVSMTAEDMSNLHLVDIDGFGGREAAISGGTSTGDSETAANSVLVNIPGPVARIEVRLVNLSDTPADVTVTDIFFESGDGAIPVDGGDLLTGGDGDDLIFGQEGDDTVSGGAGNDTLAGGTGADQLEGNDDQDLFVINSAEEGIGDTILGGDGGLDADRIDIYGERGVDWRVRDLTTDSDGNGFDGTIEFLDGVGGVTGTLDFENIEAGAVIVCFTPGTKILTPLGEVAVETLREGDQVVTRDNGLQPIRWAGRKHLTAQQLAERRELSPILIKQGALGPNQPERDMMVSPSHRMLLVSEQAELMFDEREVLVAAKHLLHLDGVEKAVVDGVDYIHFMCDNHEVVLADGAWSESFQPGEYTMDGMGKEQRAEIYAIFPELREEAGLANYTAARLSLKRHEAQLLG